MEKQEEGASPKQHHNMKGIRLRKWGRWVAEIRMPKTRQKIWLGSYDTKEQAALAYDAALYCLRGLNAKYNFPALIPSIPAANTLSRHEIQVVATKYALGELPSIPRASLPEYNSSFGCGDLPSSSASQSPSCSSENLGAPTLPSSSQHDEGNQEKQATEDDDVKKAEEELGLWESLFRNDDCSSSSATGTDATALAKLPSLDPFQCDMDFENYLLHFNAPAPQNSASLDDVDLWNFGNIF